MPNPLSVVLSETARPDPAPVAGMLAKPRLMSWLNGADDMMHNSTTRDRTRRPDAKRRAMTRKGERIAKSARLFLVLAFPPQLMIKGI